MKILVVEDDAIIRNGILKHIQWEMIGITEVKAAINAVEAFSICQSYRPDIVMTDIKMPGMNGVEMCRKLRESFPAVQIIFLTGYVEKEYLKNAIDLQAVGYIEKPLVPGKIQESIKTAVGKLEKEQYIREAALHRILMHNEENGGLLGSAGKSRIFLIHTRKHEDAILVKKLLSESAFLQKADIKPSVLDFVNPKTIAVLLERKDRAVSDKEIREIMYQAVSDSEKQVEGALKGWFLAAGKAGECSDDIQECYKTAQETLRVLSWKGWDSCAFYPEELNEYSSGLQGRKMLEEFATLLCQKDHAGASLLISNFYRELAEGKMSLNYQVHYVTDEFQRLLYKGRYGVASASKDRELPAWGSSIEEAETFDELSALLQKCVRQEGLKRDSDQRMEQKHNYIVEKVIAYMHENYPDADMSIKTLADYVYLTPTYLSNLFKKQTGITIGQYLTDLRIEEAKKMLYNPQFKLYQISEKSGYKDANYFAKIFKKKTGLTPSEYRDRQER